MNHECDSDCKEYENTDCPYDKWIIGELRFRRCPLKSQTESMSQWIRAYNMFKNGFLPNSDGWIKQSNKYIEVVSFIDSQVKLREKQEEENGRQRISSNSQIR